MENLFEAQEVANMTRTPLGNQNVNKYKDKAPLLQVAQVPIDGDFEGTVYVMKAIITPSVYGTDKYNGTFHLIDADGVKFTAYFNGMDYKFEEHHSCAVIKGVKYYRVSQKQTEVLTYKLNYISQSTVDIPISVFLKELPNYETLCSTFDSFIHLNIIKPEYVALLSKAESMGMVDAIKKETLADTYGTQIGKRILFFNAAISMVNGARALQEMDSELIYLAFLLKLWKPVDRIHGIELTAKIEDDFIVEELIYQSPLSKENKIKLLGAIRGTNNSLEGYLVSSIYQTLDTLAYKEQYLSQSPGSEIGIIY